LGGLFCKGSLEETISEGFSKRSLAVTKGRRRMCEDIYRIVAIVLIHVRPSDCGVVKVHGN
jgi:hypothetical protein